MLQLKITSNLDVLRRALTDTQRNRIPSITRNALNDAAIDARDAERLKIAQVFDRPTRFTINSPVFPKHLKATKEHLVATVGMLRDEAAGGTPPASYLSPQVQGGPRRLKPFERRLREAGILRAGEFAVPARGVRLNAYGNISGAMLAQILSQLRAYSEVGFLANETKGSRKRAGARRQARYFVPRTEGGRLPRGVYERRGRDIKAVLIFVDAAPRYRPLYKFGDAGARAAAAAFEGHWLKYFHKEFPAR